jgi:hypothetical protein
VVLVAPLKRSGAELRELAAAISEGHTPGHEVVSGEPRRWTKTDQFSEKHAQRRAELLAASGWSVAGRALSRPMLAGGMGLLVNEQSRRK